MKESWPILEARIGHRLARKLFEERGNHSEMHVTERDLGMMLACAVHLALIASQVPMGEVAERDREFMIPDGLGLKSLDEETDGDDYQWA